MTRQIHVTPGGLTALQAKIGIVVAALFLLFGLVFAWVVGRETSSSEGGLLVLQAMFLLLWVVVCLSLIIFYARLLAKGRGARQNSLIDLHLDEEAGTSSGEAGDFESRLRRLERLKQDRLISEAEYLSKREQILQERW